MKILPRPIPVRGRLLGGRFVGVAGPCDLDSRSLVVVVVSASSAGDPQLWSPRGTIEVQTWSPPGAEEVGFCGQDLGDCAEERYKFVSISTRRRFGSRLVSASPKALRRAATQRDVPPLAAHNGWKRGHLEPFAVESDSLDYARDWAGDRRSVLHGRAVYSRLPDRAGRLGSPFHDRRVARACRGFCWRSGSSACSCTTSRPRAGARSTTTMPSRQRDAIGVVLRPATSRRRHKRARFSRPAAGQSPTRRGRDATLERSTFVGRASHHPHGGGAHGHRPQHAPRAMPQRHARRRRR